MWNLICRYFSQRLYNYFSFLCSQTASIDMNCISFFHSFLPSSFPRLWFSNQRNILLLFGILSCRISHAPTIRLLSLLNDLSPVSNKLTGCFWLKRSDENASFYFFYSKLEVKSVKWFSEGISERSRTLPAIIVAFNGNAWISLFNWFLIIKCCFVTIFGNGFASFKMANRFRSTCRIQIFYITQFFFRIFF